MYRGETCEECGLPVAFFVHSYWLADDDLWNEVIGTPENPRGEGVVLCPPCFESQATASGIHVHWVATRTEKSVIAGHQHRRGEMTSIQRPKEQFIASVEDVKAVAVAFFGFGLVIGMLAGWWLL